MDESVVVLAYRLEAHLRSGSLDGGLLSVLGGTAAGCPPALSDVGALLTNLAALPRQHRQRFHGYTLVTDANVVHISVQWTNLSLHSCLSRVPLQY